MCFDSVREKCPPAWRGAPGRPHLAGSRPASERLDDGQLAEHGENKYGARAGQEETLRSRLLRRAERDAQRRRFEAVFLSGSGWPPASSATPTSAHDALGDAHWPGTSERRRRAHGGRRRRSVRSEDNVSRTIHQLEHAVAAASRSSRSSRALRARRGQARAPGGRVPQQLAAALKARKTPLCIIARTDSTTSTTPSSGPGSTWDGRRRHHHRRPPEPGGRPAGRREVPGNKQLNLILGGRTPT